MTDIKTIELQLAGWQKSDSHGRAPMVHFILQSDEDVEWFERFTAAKGKGKNHVAGQIFDAAFSLSDQDEQPRPKEELKGGPLAQLAGRFCNDPAFWGWASALPTRFAERHIGDADSARRFIIDYCGVESRRELDHNKEAAERFHKGIRIPFSEWLAGQ